MRRFADDPDAVWVYNGPIPPAVIRIAVIGVTAALTVYVWWIV